MTHTALESVLDAHKIPAKDRPAFRTLVEVGIILDHNFGRRILRGRHKQALNAVLAELSKSN